MIFVRLYHHTPIFNPDKRHIHHKMLAAGLTQHQALFAILGIQLMFMVVNGLLVPHLDITLIVLLDILLFMGINAAITHRINGRKKQPV